MRLLLLGHYEIASNYAISLLVERLLGDVVFDLSVALSGYGDKKLESATDTNNEFVRLANYERQLCDELNRDQDRLGLAAKGFDQIAEQIGRPIERLLNPNSEKGLTKLKQWAPDLIVSIRYRKIFHAPAIAIPAQGIINLHSGLLPEYRGAMATFWSMLNQESVYGSTLHLISDRSIDTGAIIKRSVHKLDKTSTYLKNVLNLYPPGIEAIGVALKQMQENGGIDVQIQKNKGKYYSFPKIKDLELFHEGGARLF